MMSNSVGNDVEVAIVGAGPTGLVLGLLLHQYGVQTVVVEQHDSTYDEPRAVGISGESLRICQQLGILDRLTPELRMDVGHRYFGVDGRVLAETLPGRTPDGFPAKSVFDQPQLEALLAQRAREVGLEVRFQTEATLLGQDEHGVNLALAGLTGSQTLRADWLVGCDGGRSGIRKSLGISLDGATQQERWVCYDVTDDPHDEYFAELHCNGVRPVVVAPGARRRCRYEVMLHPHEVDEDFLEFSTIKEILAPYRELEVGQVRRARVYVAQQRLARSVRKDRVLLSGDAYHLMPPFAGQGLNSGFRDSANLAWKLAAVVNGRANQGLLDTYGIERRPHVRDMINTSVRIGKVVMVVRPTLAKLRDAVLRSLKVIPPLWTWVTQMKFMKAPKLTEGCIVTTRTARRGDLAGLLGRPIAQLAIAGTDTRFDDTLGEGWALLETGGRGEGTVQPEALEQLAALVDARRLRLVRGPANAHSETAEVVVADAAWIRTPEQPPVWVLVRPDRFVAAAFTADEAPQVVAGLSGWYDGIRARHAS